MARSFVGLGFCTSVALRTASRPIYVPFSSLSRFLCGVGHSASVFPVRKPPLQTVRADFPHTASLVKLVSLVSFPYPFRSSFALIPTDTPRSSRAVSDAPPQGGLSPLVGLSTITFLLAIQFASSPFTSRGPSLHGHCPASTLLWPRPTPADAFTPQASQVPDATFQTRRPSMPRHAFCAANRLRRFFSASRRMTRWPHGVLTITRLNGKGSLALRLTCL